MAKQIRRWVKKAAKKAAKRAGKIAPKRAAKVAAGGGKATGEKLALRKMTLSAKKAPAGKSAARKTSARMTRGRDLAGRPVVSTKRVRRQREDGAGSPALRKIVLNEAAIPRSWYNIAADLPAPVPPPLHPGTLQPVGPADLAPLFPMALIMQEVSAEREVDIPEQMRRQPIA